jgi:hypothetical protein
LLLFLLPVVLAVHLLTLLIVPAAADLPLLTAL